ncbi:hypothetical protein B0A55_02069 [Friedmanniomyces simplex]|uniref:Uncharacterized protein n=1 Tax=Friedmanniomyces simplex TaxID=329884 RepID=A0A4U0XZE7_9PEZI|nr:hypothetical protein B0A55_02069 [Friedmanniomyces simplex]
MLTHHLIFETPDLLGSTSANNNLTFAAGCVITERVIQAHIEEEHAEDPTAPGQPASAPEQLPGATTSMPPEKRQTRASIARAKASAPSELRSEPASGKPTDTSNEIVSTPKKRYASTSILQNIAMLTRRSQNRVKAARAKAPPESASEHTANKLADTTAADTPPKKRQTKARVSKAKAPPHSASDPTPTKPNHFTKLPPELRNRIYDLVVPTGDRLIGPWEEPPILCVSKQIRHETSPIFYKHNEFQPKTRLEANCTGKLTYGEAGGRFKAAIRKLASIVEICGPQPFGKFRIVFIGKTQSYIVHMLPLLELMRCGFEPADEPQEPVSVAKRKYVSIFETRMLADAADLDAFERAVKLGRRARVEEWTGEKLKERFKAMLSSVAPEFYPRDLW